MDIAVFEPVVAGAVSGFGVVLLGLRRHFAKMDQIDKQENRIQTLETKVESFQSYGAKLDQLIADVSYLKGRLISHDEWERETKYPKSPRAKR